MEDRKNTDFGACGCPNNYTQSTFFESFGRSDDEMRKCNACENMEYECGILTCKKFQG